MLSPSLEAVVWALFQRYDDKEWSHTDLLALAQDQNIHAVFAFDEHCWQMPGVRRLPE